MHTPTFQMACTRTPKTGFAKTKDEEQPPDLFIQFLLYIYYVYVWFTFVRINDF
jgi:hypothetical protein